MMYAFIRRRKIIGQLFIWPEDVAEIKEDFEERVGCVEIIPIVGNCVLNQ